MQIKTILNRIQKFKSFVYGAVRWVEGASVPTLEVEIQPRLNSRPLCSGCGYKRPGDDRLPEGLFEFIRMWGHQVFFRYVPRRVDCPPLWCPDRTDAVGIRQAPADRSLCLVSGQLGEAPELERNGRGIPYSLGSTPGIVSKRWQSLLWVHSISSLFSKCLMR